MRRTFTTRCLIVVMALGFCVGFPSPSKAANVTVNGYGGTDDFSTPCNSCAQYNKPIWQTEDSNLNDFVLSACKVRCQTQRKQEKIQREQKSFPQDVRESRRRCDTRLNT